MIGTRMHERHADRAGAGWAWRTFPMFRIGARHYVRNMHGAPGGDLAAFRLTARQGEPFWSDDTVTVVMVSPDRTGGRVAVVEQLLVAGRERPPRIDADGDEVLYVLDGILDVQIDTCYCTAERGAVLFVPRGQAVTMRVLSRTARTLLVIAPVGEATLRSLVTA